MSLTVIHHPHTGEKLATALNDCLVDWGIEAGKIMLIVSDNGSNMIKAIRLLKEMNADDGCNMMIVKVMIMSLTMKVLTMSKTLKW